MKSISLALLSFVALAAAARKNCVIPSSGGGDDSDAIIDTFKSCSTKSKVVFSAGTTYNVHKPMNISGLNDVHVSLEGNVLFSDDVPYWQSNVFLLNYQSAGTWWVFGGKKITIDGGGSINGNAQSWWNQKITTTRPVMLTFDKVQDLTVSGISLLQSPFWHMFVRDVTKAKFKKLLIKSVSNSTSVSWSAFICIYIFTNKCPPLFGYAVPSSEFRRLGSL
jgi:galacturan 1,4-alpha-galacturonidase